MRSYWVYILTNRSGIVHVGVTNDLYRRLIEHLQREIPGFTAYCHIDRLVYVKGYGDIEEATVREMQIKGWSRRMVLIVTENPGWRDLVDTIVGE